MKADIPEFLLKNKISLFHYRNALSGLQNKMLLLVLFSFLVISCHKDHHVKNVDCLNFVLTDEGDAWICSQDFCDSSLCIGYLNIWKELFLEKNEMDSGFFSDHIFPCSYELQVWNDGISFNICYKIKVDWAVAFSCDQFIVKIDSSINYYPQLAVARGSYLSRQDIVQAMAINAFNSEISKVSPQANLKYASRDEALNDLAFSSHVEKLCFSRNYLDWQTGHLILEASAQYIDKDNLCIYGNIDLYTGKTEISDGPCWINK